MSERFVRPPDLYGAIQIVRAYLGIATPEQISQDEEERLSKLEANGSWYPCVGCGRNNSVHRSHCRWCGKALR